jgi:hypothetical protein
LLALCTYDPKIMWVSFILKQYSQAITQHVCCRPRLLVADTKHTQIFMRFLWWFNFRRYTKHEVIKLKLLMGERKRIARQNRRHGKLGASLVFCICTFWAHFHWNAVLINRRSTRVCVCKSIIKSLRVRGETIRWWAQIFHLSYIPLPFVFVPNNWGMKIENILQQDDLFNFIQTYFFK